MILKRDLEMPEFRRTKTWTQGFDLSEYRYWKQSDNFDHISAIWDDWKVQHQCKRFLNFTVISASGVNQAAFKAAERAFKALNERHSGLCEELQQAEEHACSLERAIEECEVRCAKLHHNSEDTDVNLDAKIRLCEAARAEVYQLPPWALRCAWRDALDLRASQLERVSGQLDGTKRSLDAANEELNWQATSAEALRTRLTDLLQATLAEERRGNQFSLEEARRRQTLQAGQKCIEENLLQTIQDQSGHWGMC